MHILISGGSGFLGRVLVKTLLSSGHKVTVYTHQKKGMQPKFDDKLIKVITAEDDFPDVDVIVNLSGEPIDSKRLTKNRLNLILSSRLDTIELLFNRYANRMPRQFIQASATGIYQNLGEYAEDGDLGDSVYAALCRQIEDKAKSLFGNVTIARLGVIVGDGGGLKRNLRFMPAVHFIRGDNLIPYITVNDCADAMDLVIKKRVLGEVNFCSSQYMSLNELMKLCSGFNKVTIPCPSFVLSFDKRGELLKANHRIIPNVLLKLGFVFTKK